MTDFAPIVLHCEANAEGTDIVSDWLDRWVAEVDGYEEQLTICDSLDEMFQDEVDMETLQRFDLVVRPATPDSVVVIRLMHSTTMKDPDLNGWFWKTVKHPDSEQVDFYKEHEPGCFRGGSDGLIDMYFDRDSHHDVELELIPK